MATEAPSQDQSSSKPTPAWPPQPIDPTAPYDATTLRNKTVLITGGASGIGAALARNWASHGAHIFIGDVDEGAGLRLVAELRESTGSPHHHFQRTDVTSWRSQVGLFRAARRLSASGEIDAVVPNAGIAHDGGGGKEPGFEEVREDVLVEGDGAEEPMPPRSKILDVNLTGVMYTVHLALNFLAHKPGVGAGTETEARTDGRGQKEGGGRPDKHILLVGSIAGIMPLVGSVDYTVSKHGVTGLFRSLRGTAWRRGIRVNMICPCFIDTPLVGNEVMMLLAGGGLGSLDDVVDAGTRFMADESIVGRALVIGPKMEVEDGQEDGEMKLVRIPEKDGDGKGVWECYAHDYEHMEAFFYRYTRLLVGFAIIRGWSGWARDVLWAMFGRKSGK